MKRWLNALAVLPMLVGASSTMATSAKQTGSAFDFSFVAIDGAPLPMSVYQGKVLLVVNTASFCGFTGQYAGLQALHERYGPQGLVVIGVPSNDFGAQEPKANAEIADFCQGAFNVTFALAEKQTVKGAGAHPFYRWAADVLGNGAAPRWNFHKYLVGRDGQLIGGYAAQVAPGAPAMSKAIEAALVQRR